jgi:hypothetical protein
VGGALNTKHSAKKTKKQILKSFKSFSVKTIDKQKELVYAAGCRDRSAPAAAKLREPDARKEAPKVIGKE